MWISLECQAEIFPFPLCGLLTELIQRLRNNPQALEEIDKQGHGVFAAGVAVRQISTILIAIKEEVVPVTWVRQTGF